MVNMSIVTMRAGAVLRHARPLRVVSLQYLDPNANWSDIESRSSALVCLA
jgi:hypothetical protein